MAGALAVLALGYAGRLDGEYLWDDVELVEHNATLTDRGGLRRILTTDLVSGAGLERVDLFRPVPVATLWLQAQLGGLTVARGRAFNVAAHAVTAALLLVLLLRLAVPPLAAALLALFFLAHPSATEPVMWLSGRHDLLGALCSLGAACAWPRPDAARPWPRALAAGLLCALAFLSKETYVIAPLLVLALGWAERARAGQQARAALPLLAVLGVFAWRHALGIRGAGDRLAVPIATQLRHAGSIVWHYLVQLLTVSNGTAIESYAPLSSSGALLVLAVAAAIGALLVTAGARVLGRAAALGLAVFLLALAPQVLSIPPAGMWANRYAYLPLAGLCVVAGACCAAAATRAVRRELALGAGALVLVLIGAGALRTRAEAEVWRDDLALFGASALAHPEDGRALYYYGYAVQHREGCARSLPLFAGATRHAPEYVRGWRNLAGCLIEVGRPADAIEPARRAVALDPTDAAHRYNLGAALVLDGRREEGERSLAEALRLDPRHARAAALLARLRAQ